jgi:D-glycero-alpha-D-manno-heptose 1-phosphate guanylyltransferase
MMEAIILAGGMGTRLRKTIGDIPKPMAPVNGRPFLYYVLNWLKDHPVEKILISTGYRSGSIIDYFGESFTGIPLEYIVEKSPLGTGGALMLALQQCSGSDVLVVNGDTYFPVPLESFFLFHTSMGNRFTVALKHMTCFSRYGSVECSGETIICFNEKKFCADGLINGGIYMVNREFFRSLKLPEVFSLESDVLEKQAGASILKCRIFDEPFIDIGTPEDYSRAGDYFERS